MACGRLPKGTVWELLVISREETAELKSIVSRIGGITIRSTGSYAADFKACIARASGRCIITMESNLAHNPFIIPELYASRDLGDIVIASRYVRNGYFNGSWLRRFLSRSGNTLFRKVLDFPVYDLTSSFRLYNLRVFENTDLRLTDEDVLLEILVNAYAQGFKLAEIPFHYNPSQKAPSATTWRTGRSCLRSLGGLWRLRNSIDCADYDERAFNSRIWFQRSWQRRRYRALVRMAQDAKLVLDVGCGSSQVIEGLPQSDCCDLRLNKLRHKRAPGRVLVRASVFDLPFKTNFYDAVIFSQVIEHLPKDPRVLQEIVRVAKPGGHVIVGTPDYATWWTTVEKIYGAVHPGGYADEHITHYTFETLKKEIESLGCRFIDHAYVWHAELIMRFQKL
ncbi:MAG: methyltransferase domain-containing protein [Candidatus Sumerlaeaceae bacterium]